jgi:hypothetical protein
LQKIIHHQHGQAEHGRFKRIKLERHSAVDDPAHNNQKGCHEEGDLEGSADDEADGKVEVVLHGRVNRRHVLACIADDRNDDEADEGAGNVEGLDDAVDAVNQVVGAHGYAEGGEDQYNAGGPEAKLLISRFFCFEEVRVRHHLEVEVDEV